MAADADGGISDGVGLLVTESTGILSGGNKTILSPPCKVC